MPDTLDSLGMNKAPLCISPYRLRVSKVTASAFTLGNYASKLLLVTACQLSFVCKVTTFCFHWEATQRKLILVTACQLSFECSIIKCGKYVNLVTEQSCLHAPMYLSDKRFQHIGVQSSRSNQVEHTNYTRKHYLSPNQLSQSLEQENC